MTEQWAVILGASSGVGAATACAAAEAGLHVFGMHRGNHPEGAADVAAKIQAAGRRCEMVVTDAGTPDGVAVGAKALLDCAGTGNVKLFVHSIANASIGRFIDPKGKRQFHSKQFDKTLQSMANSFVYWAQQMVQDDLLAPCGRLYGLTNPIPKHVAHGFGLIAASKALLEIYVRHLAMEMGPLGHRVNLVNFGLVETPAVRMAFDDEGWAHASRSSARVTPAGRIQTTAEVARFITLLLHPAADYMNGATLDFTGGQAQGLLNPIFHKNTLKE